MPATWVPWADSTTPMLTKSAFPLIPAGVEVDVLAVLDDEGIDSAIAVAGLSVPKWPTSNLSL